MDGQLLYNLAVWYGIAQNMSASDIPGAKQSARRYLIYSLVRDDNFWHMAKHDSSFVNVFTLDEFDALKTIIDRKVSEVPALQNEKEPGFTRHIDEILSAISSEEA